MAYDEVLAARVRAALGPLPGLAEMKMFGGIGFTLHGNMACGVIQDDLIVRVGPTNHAAALARPHARPFDMTGRPMAGWVFVGPQGCASEKDLEDWVRQGLDFARSLPAKEK
jgi:TfoX/Sxy family transcriptional regulator of competence genes